MALGKKMRVVIPTAPADLLDLADDVYAKHTADGASSVLNSLEDQNWAVEGPKIALAKAKHSEAETLKLQMEKAYRDRDLLLAPVKDAVIASRDLLTGVMRSNMKRMGDWGFTVNDTPTAKKKE